MIKQKVLDIMWRLFLRLFSNEVNSVHEDGRAEGYGVGYDAGYEVGYNHGGVQEREWNREIKRHG